MGTLPDVVWLVALVCVLVCGSVICMSVYAVCTNRKYIQELTVPLSSRLLA